MEACSCELRKKAVAELKMFTVGTRSPGTTTASLPPNTHIKWIGRRVSITRDVDEPTLIGGDYKIDKNPCIPKIWCPFEDRLVSLKAVNEGWNPARKRILF